MAGEIVSLGKGKAVGIVGPFKLSGLVPSLLKRADAYRYLYSIGGPGLVLDKLGWGSQVFSRSAD